MDLLTLSARLFLDTGDYSQGLDDALRSAASFSQSLTETLNGVSAQAEASLGGLAGRAPTWGGDLMSGFISGIRSMWGALRQAVEDVAGLVRSYLGFSEPEQGPLSNFHTYAPDMMALFASGIRDNARLVTDQAAAAFDLAPVLSQSLPAPQSFEIPAQPSRPVQVIFEFDGVQKWVYSLTQAEQQRVGVKLGGGAL